MNNLVTMLKLNTSALKYPKIKKIINIYGRGKIDVSKKRTYLFLGDLHGNIKSAIHSSIMIQVNYGYPVDVVFQVGDFGYWPRGVASKNSDPNFKKDDALDFFEIENSIDQKTFFEIGKSSLEILKAPIYFIRGNHEDFEFINKLEKHKIGNLISSYIYYIPDYFLGNIGGLNIAAVGGILTDLNKGRGSKTRDELKKNKKRLEWDERLSDASKLVDFGGGETDIDILMTHSGLACRENRHGSRQLEEFLSETTIPIHFHGHHHRFACGIIGKNTLSIGLKNYDINSENQVNEGSFALVEWVDRENFKVHVNYSKNVL
jgi:Icc-related predicted phosphoesterase